MQAEELMHAAQVAIGEPPTPIFNAQSLPPDDQMGTIDKLALKVIPKLLDRIRSLEYECKLAGFCIGFLAEQIPEARGKGRAKGGKQREPRTRIEIEPAMYSRAVDGKLMPLVVDDIEITGETINKILNFPMEAETEYGMDVCAYVRGLPDEVRDKIREVFP